MSRTQKLKGLVAASLILKTLNDNPYTTKPSTPNTIDHIRCKFHLYEF